MTEIEIKQKELTVLKGQVSKLETRANSISIAIHEDYESAIDIVSGLKEAGSIIKKKKESITKPLNEALKNARDLFKPIEDQFKSAETIVKTKLLDYKKKKDEEARIKEEKIAKSLENGNIKMDTAERKMDEVERVENTTNGKVGQIQMRKVRKVRIKNESQLPREYLVPDEVKIRRDALDGVKIPGVEVYEEETIAAR